MAVKAASQDAHQRSVGWAEEWDPSSVSGIRLCLFIGLLRIHVVCQRSLPNAYAYDEQKEDDDKNDAEGIDSLDVSRVPREDHGQDNHQEKQTGVWKAELRPISFHLDSCIASWSKQKYRVQALWENLKVEDQGNVEVENEAAHGYRPSISRKDSVHRVSEVSILPGHTKHQVVGRKAE